MSLIYSYLKLARIHQYSKNLFILAPIFFAFKLTNIDKLENSIIAFISFCFVASSVYVFNDLLDIKADKAHPIKCKRPLASGEVSKKSGIVFMLALLLAGILISFIKNNEKILIIFAIYIAINILYSIKLKHISILDIVIIGIGFVLRLFIGGFAIGVTPSTWIIVLTFLLSLFLAIAKRRDDVNIYEKSGIKTRSVIDGYNKIFCDIGMAMSGSITILAYIFWSISEEVVQKLQSSNLYLTSIFVIIGILRYMQITFVLEKSGSPSKIVLKDRFLQSVILAWLLSFLLILYIK